MHYTEEQINNLIDVCERMIRTADRKLSENLEYSEKTFYIEYKKSAENQLKYLKAEKNRITNKK